MYVGGLENIVLHLSRHFAEAGHHVVVVTTDSRGPWWERLAEFELAGSHYSRQAFISGFAHARQIGRHLSEYDLVFLHHAPIAQAVLGMLPDEPIVIPVIHNDTPAVYHVACANSLCWNVVVATSSKIGEVAAARVKHRPVVCIRNGIPLPPPSVRSDGVDLRRAPRLVFVGRIEHRQKGVFLLPEILGAVRRAGFDATLSVIGAGPDLTALREKFREIGLAEAVKFHGVLAQEHVYAHLLSSDILLMPSFHEGLPLVLLEAQASGCVPIVSRLPAPAEAVKEGITGILTSIGDPLGFAAQVIRLARNPDEWRSMSATAREHATAMWSFDNTAHLYLALIERAQRREFPLPRSRRTQPAVDLSLLDGWRSLVPDALRRVRRAWKT